MYCVFTGILTNLIINFADNLLKNNILIRYKSITSVLILYILCQYLTIIKKLIKQNIHQFNSI